MEKDAFLRAHRIHKLHYAIDAHQSPFSIRDQMLRARILVDRAYRAGNIRAHRPLLVVGAGAGGVSAALRSAEIGIPTTLIDRGKVPFGSQLNCKTRVICPTQYDWPLTHWQLKEWPWTDSLVELPWVRGKAYAVAIEWLDIFNKAISDRKFTFLEEHTLDADVLEANGGAFRENADTLLDVAFTGVAEPQAFGMLLSCTGPGTESVEIDAFRGWKFWEDDKLQFSNYGITRPLDSPHPVRTLISGGGDGALQDFIRAATKVDTVDTIMKEVLRCLDEPLSSDYSSQIFSIEDQYQRAYAWSGERSDDCRIESEVENQYKELVAQLVGGSAWPRICAYLRGIVSTDAKNLFISHRHYHFVKSYALNRIVALLLIQFLQREFGTTVRLRNREITSITGVNHVCELRPADCIGAEHTIAFSGSVCGDSPSGPSATYPDPFHVIVLRHGLDNSEKIDWKTRLGRGRHLLPYRLM